MEIQQIEQELRMRVVISCCQMKRAGEDVAEKLDYAPGVFTVECHIRGRWACARRAHRSSAVQGHVTDRGIPTAGPLPQVLVVNGGFEGGQEGHKCRSS